MSLCSGNRLGPYEIVSLLGAGGMGEVYKARDTRLNRTIAIKVLASELTDREDLRERFEREARVISSLNHPHICTLHDVGRHEGTDYIVMEFVEGTTLAERLQTGPLPLKESLEIGGQIAQALEVAHEKGIIHRDLKPGNIKFTPDGKVKVLDFGLAKALTEPTALPSSQAATMTAEATRLGVILGTAGYMSPEQARGGVLDKRTDIWAFGCVLYEMMAGRRAFEGQTASDRLAAVLSRDPEWEALPEEIPTKIKALVRRCLQKDPKHRLRDIGDARIELEEILLEPLQPEGAEVLPRSAPLLQRALKAIAFTLAGAVAAAAVTWSFLPRAPGPTPVVRFTMTLPPGQIISAPGTPAVALSPDGTQLVYVAAGQLFLRRLDQLESKPIPGTVGASTPFFSPDGQWIAFRQSFRLKRVALSGGAPVSICDAEIVAGGSWGADGNIVFVDNLYQGVLRVPAAGGTPELITRVDSKNNERLHRAPELLLGGKAVLFTVGMWDIDSYDDARIAVQSLDGGKHKILIEGGINAHYSPSGHLVYTRSGALLAVPFDLEKLAVTGPPVPVVDGVLQSVTGGTAHFSLSPNGTLAYVAGTGVGASRLPVWVDREGRAQPLPLPPRGYLHPRVSPDGGRLAIETEGPTHNFFTYDLGRGVLTKLSFDGSSHWPLWTPDGKHLTFRSWRTGTFTMWWMPADRSGPEERLVPAGARQSAASWAPDGRAMAFTEVDAENGPDIWVLEMEGQRRPRPFLQTKFAEGSPKFSPDGRWIAYCSNESGRNEIYVQPYPGPGPRIQISAEGGTDPVWAKSGKELFYRDRDKMMIVEVSLDPSLKVLKPRVLWEGQYAHGMSSSCGPAGPTSSNYDVTPDGQRFIMIRENEQEARSNQIHVVLNWSEELKRLSRE